MAALGFVVIVILYATIGLLAAAGTFCIVSTILGSRAQAFFGAFLAMIAAFYLAFAAYFDSAAAWRVETFGVLGFAVMGLLGVRLTPFLVVGYALHGLWDVLHELQAHGVSAGFLPGQLTDIPLAYGVFCAAFDLCVAAYFLMHRRIGWLDGLKPKPSDP